MFHFQVIGVSEKNHCGEKKLETRMVSLYKPDAEPLFSQRFLGSFLIIKVKNEKIYKLL